MFRALYHQQQFIYGCRRRLWPARQTVARARFVLCRFVSGMQVCQTQSNGAGSFRSLTRGTSYRWISPRRTCALQRVSSNTPLRFSSHAFAGQCEACTWAYLSFRWPFRCYSSSCPWTPTGLMHRLQRLQRLLRLQQLQRCHPGKGCSRLLSWLPGTGPSGRVSGCWLSSWRGRSSAGCTWKSLTGRTC